MSDRILVTYASRTGTTAGVAEAIGNSLAAKGARVDVLPMSTAKNLSAYHAVVAGSAIRASKWLPEALEFVSKNQAVLSTKPFAIFTVCITIAMTNGENYRSGVATWVQPVRALVKPVNEGYFGGRLDFNKLPKNFDTLKLRAMVASGIFPKGDCRDWQAIRTWAESLQPQLA
jgi:menaquinone-dependent protoporphyrinogen oxidase